MMSAMMWRGATVHAGTFLTTATQASALLIVFASGPVGFACRWFSGGTKTLN